MPIYWHKKEEIIDAYVYKNLMVHKIPTDETKHVWTISHVGTGFCVGLDYPPFRIMKEAKEMVEELTKDDDWYVPTVRLDWQQSGRTVAFDDERAKILLKILRSAWEKLYGIRYVSNDAQAAEQDTAIPERVSKVYKCAKCGGEPQRHALGKNKDNKYGWFSFCLKCEPYDDNIVRTEGSVTRW